MSNLKKSWKTTLIGLVILGGLLYKAFTVGFSIQDAVYGFIAVGFLMSKDSDKSHSEKVKKKVVDGDKPDGEYPPKE